MPLDNERRDPDPFEIAREVREEHRHVLQESLEKRMWSDSCACQCREAQSEFLIILIAKVATGFRNNIPLHGMLKEIEERYGALYTKSVKAALEKSAEEWPVLPSC